MAYPKETRDKLRRAYVFDGLSLEIAAAQMNIPYVTARRWKKDAADTGDNWDKQRGAHMFAGGGIEDVTRSLLSGLVIQFNSTIETLNAIDINKIKDEERVGVLKKRVEMLASLSDSYNKCIAASKRLLPETSQLAVSMETLQKLSEFISSHYPQHLAAFVDILEPFGEELEKSYG